MIHRIAHRLGAGRLIMQRVRKRLLVLPGVFLIGFLSATSGLRSLLDPDRNPLHVLYGGWDWVWAVGYLAAGLLVAGGIVAFNRRAELSGQYLLASAILVQTLATEVVLPLSETWVSWTTAAGVILMCAIRIYLLKRDYFVVITKARENDDLTRG